MKLSYVLDGKPIPLLRTRYGKNKVWDSQKEIKLLQGITLSKQHGNNPPFSGTLSLNITFFFQTPQSLSQKKKNILLGKFHTSKPDIDNLVKFILDIGNSILYKDDSSFAEIYAKKVYDTNSRTEFIIEEL